MTDAIDSAGFFSWSQLRRLLGEGMEIGSHSRSHPHLEKINNPGILWDQIYSSKQILESQLGTAVEDFAYPYGSYNATTASAVRSAGYNAWPGGIGGPIRCVCAQSSDGPDDLAKFKNYLRSRQLPPPSHSNHARPMLV